MKTMQGWKESHSDLSDYLDIGDAVDGEIYDYILGVLPPACNSSRYLQLGEPSRHDNQGRACFETLKKDGDQWIYAGTIPVPDGETDNYVY